MKHKPKSISQLCLLIILMLGVTGCMFNTEKRVTKQMLNYLEDKYGEPFVAESFERGSRLFPEMYGGDKMMVYPASNRDIPFYVYKNVKLEGHSDNYIMSYFSYQFTEKYKHEIDLLDDREKEVKFSFGFSNPPVDTKVLRTSIDEFAKDQSYDGRLDLHIVIKFKDDLNISSESVFLYSLYEYMKGKTNREFAISIGYINESYFEQAVELIRIAHTINFSWTILDEEALIQGLYFNNRNDINDASYFEKLFK